MDEKDKVLDLILDLEFDRFYSEYVSTFWSPKNPQYHNRTIRERIDEGEINNWDDMYTYIDREFYHG